MASTKISWTDKSWNPLTGCSPASEGCANCYAEQIVALRPQYFPRGFTPQFRPERLVEPAKWPTPQRVFVGSMTDVFHEAHATDEIEAVFDVMVDVPWHRYQLLTKRPDRMRAFVTQWLAHNGRTELPEQIAVGVTIECDRHVGRADILRQVPAQTRFVSAEPLLGPLPTLNLDQIAWLIVGGESGRVRRPMELAWARALRDKAAASGTAFFFKQVGGIRPGIGTTLDGKEHKAFPPGLSLPAATVDALARKAIARAILAKASVLPSTGSAA